MPGLVFYTAPQGGLAEVSHQKSWRCISALCRMLEEIYVSIMKKTQYLTLFFMLAGTTVLYGQAKPDAAKGKVVFDQQCGICHDAATTDKKMGPGLKGLFKRP